MGDSVQAGDRYNREFSDGKIIITFASDGEYKVHGKQTADGMAPVMDIKGEEITKYFGAAGDELPMTMNDKGFTIG